MKKISIVLVLIVFSFSAYSQLITVFHEDFESPSFADSMVSTQSAVPGTDDYGLCNRSGLTSGSYCDSCQVKTGKTTYLTSASFNTTGSSQVLLEFRHICKVDQLDGGYIEVSNNGGFNWVQLLGNSYVDNISLQSPGAALFAVTGNKFTSSAYGITWYPAQPLSLPIVSWWRKETFDVSSVLANCPNAKIRFRLPDGGSAGPGGNPPSPGNNKGWYLDDIQVKILPNSTISGVVLYAHKTNTGVYAPYPVGNTPFSCDSVRVVLMQGNTVMFQACPNTFGFYEFTNVPFGQYTVKALVAKKWGGVNTLDAHMIMGNLLGISWSILIPPWLKAGEINGIGSIPNSLDALLIQRRFVGIIPNFMPPVVVPGRPDWYSESFILNVAGGVNLSQDIRVLCTGDVNGSY